MVESILEHNQIPCVDTEGFVQLYVKIVQLKLLAQIRSFGLILICSVARKNRATEIWVE